MAIHEGESATTNRPDKLSFAQTREPVKKSRWDGNVSRKIHSKNKRLIESHLRVDASILPVITPHKQRPAQKNNIQHNKSTRYRYMPNYIFGGKKTNTTAATTSSIIKKTFHTAEPKAPQHCCYIKQPYSAVRDISADGIPNNSRGNNRNNLGRLTCY